VLETNKTEVVKGTASATASTPSPNRRRHLPWVSMFLLVAMTIPSLYILAQEPRVITLTADHDNKFKVPGQKEPSITVKAKEVVKFKVTAHKGTELDDKRPGCVHSFSVKELKDQGWDVCLKEGANEFVLVAPSKPGEYKIECLAKCGKGHDDMAMKLIVQ
jgi:heme/copper-type cytochrome/quinol oxidase subunit 2